MENNDIKMPTSLLDELRMRKQAIKDARQVVCVETIKYKSKIKKYEDLIERERGEVRVLGDKPINVSLETLVEEIAKEWKTGVENLDVRVKFFNTAKFEKMERNEFLRYYINSNKDSLVYMTLIVDSKNCENHFETAIGMDLFEKQRNGQMLKDFLIVETRYNGKFITDFVCSNYKNLIFNYKFSYLIDINKCVPINKNAEIIYKAYKRDCEEKENSYGKE